MRLLKASLPYVWALGALGIVSPAVAAPAAASWSSLQWSAEPVVLVPIVLTTLWYLVGFGRLRQVGSFRPLYGARQLLCYLAGELTLVLALLSPLDELADQLFSAHMLEHMLLLMLAAPLLVWGRPAVAFLWAFGPAGRKRVGRTWHALGLTSGVNGLMHPLLVWALFCGVFIAWHLPAPYQWALRDETVHTFEHVTFLVTALMFWTIVIEPSGRRRLDYGATLLFILAGAVVSSLPGAVITLAGTALYPDYGAGTTRWGLSLLQDQQLAGLLMWVPGGVAYLIAAGGVLLRWLEFDDSRRPAVKRRLQRRAQAAAVPGVASPDATLAPAATAVVPTSPVLTAPVGVSVSAAPLRTSMHSGSASVIVLCISSLVLMSLSGCNSSTAASDDASMVATIGDPHRGAALIRSAGCGSCHVVPGVDDANGMVGPSLMQMGLRTYIAGMLRNTPPNMIQWLQSPQRIVPGNAMPDMGLSIDQARDITAYLYTLR